MLLDSPPETDSALLVLDSLPPLVEEFSELDLHSDSVESELEPPPSLSQSQESISSHRPSLPSRLELLLMPSRDRSPPLRLKLSPKRLERLSLTPSPRSSLNRSTESSSRMLRPSSTRRSQERSLKKSNKSSTTPSAKSSLRRSQELSRSRSLRSRSRKSRRSSTTKSLRTSLRLLKRPSLMRSSQLRLELSPKRRQSRKLEPDRSQLLTPSLSPRLDSEMKNSLSMSQSPKPELDRLPRTTLTLSKERDRSPEPSDTPQTPVMVSTPVLSHNILALTLLETLISKMILPTTSHTSKLASLVLNLPPLPLSDSPEHTENTGKETHLISHLKMMSLSMPVMLPLMISTSLLTLQMMSASSMIPSLTTSESQDREPSMFHSPTLNRNRELEPDRSHSPSRKKKRLLESPLRNSSMTVLP